MDKTQKQNIYLIVSEVDLKENDLHRIIQENNSHDDNRSLANALRKIIPNKWMTSNDNSYGTFNYDGCYITLKNKPGETRLFELIGELLLPQM